MWNTCTSCPSEGKIKLKAESLGNCNRAFSQELAKAAINEPSRRPQKAQEAQKRDSDFVHFVTPTDRTVIGAATSRLQLRTAAEFA